MKTKTSNTGLRSKTAMITRLKAEPSTSGEGWGETLGQREFLFILFMTTRIVLPSLFLICVSTVLAQKYDNVWVLGYHGQNPHPLQNNFLFDFNQNPTDIIPLNLNIGMYLSEVNASICNNEGDLLFYTNGIYIANADHEIMENGDSLNNFGITYQNSSSGVHIPQGALILPMPGNDSIFVILHEPVDFGQNGLNTHAPLIYFTEVNIKEDNGLGKVIEKNQLILQDTLAWGKITACKHANGRDWWIIIPENDASNNTIYRFLLSPSGISNLGKQNLGGIIYDTPSGGNALFSPDGTMYIRHDLRFDPWNAISIYDFDRCNGVLTLMTQFELQDTSFLYGGASISPDSRYLYTVTNNSIYQFDLNASNIESTITIVANYDKSVGLFYPSVFGTPQLAPDGQIYIAAAVTDTVMHVIRTPNQPGTACHVDQHAIHLPKVNQKSIPNFPNYRLGPLDSSPCDTLGLDNHPLAGFTWWPEETGACPCGVTFSDNSFYRPESWAWDFGDGGTSTERNPLHAYNAPGEYQVCLTVANEYDSDAVCHWVQVDTLLDSVSLTTQNLLAPFLRVNPNPASDYLTIEMTKPFKKDMIWVLLDPLGHEVVKEVLPAGSQKVLVKLDALQSGLYFWKMRKDGKNLGNGKLLILH